MNGIKSFFANIDRLPVKKRNALREEAKRTLEDSLHSSSYGIFFSCLPDPNSIPEELESRYYFSGCLHCLWPADTKKRLPVEEILWRMGQDKAKAKRLEHDLGILLDYQWFTGDILPGKIYHLARIVKQEGYAIDCAALLEDLIDWDDLKQIVQLKWARSLYMKPEAEL